MIADLTILPIGHGPHISTLLAEVLQDIQQQGLRHQLTATGTCLEGTWDQIVHAAKRAHAIARKHTPHVVTLLKIEEDAEATNELRTNVESVKQKVEAEQTLPDEATLPLVAVPTAVA